MVCVHNLLTLPMRPLSLFVGDTIVKVHLRLCWGQATGPTKHKAMPPKRCQLSILHVKSHPNLLLSHFKIQDWLLNNEYNPNGVGKSHFEKKTTCCNWPFIMHSSERCILFDMDCSMIKHSDMKVSPCASIMHPASSDILSRVYGPSMYTTLYIVFYHRKARGGAIFGVCLERWWESSLMYHQILPDLLNEP